MSLVEIINVIDFGHSLQSGSILQTYLIVQMMYFISIKYANKR